MTGWFALLMIVLGVFGRPTGNAEGPTGVRAYAFTYAVWGIVMLGLIFAILVDRKGWP